MNMNSLLHFGTIPALVLILGLSANAETVTVDVTIKSVKVESRGLEVTYKTNLGDKTVVLDVSRKATITINDSVGSLEELKPGYTATVEYHKDLAIVTKITATAISYEEATQEDMKAMQGEWKCIAGSENGKSKNSEIKRRQRRLIVKGNSLTMERNSNDGSIGRYIGKFEIDASNGHFDWVGKAAAGGLSEWIGIYELDGDTLKLSFIYQNDDKAKRPTELKSFPPQQPGLAHAYYTFERTTSEKREN